MEQQYEHLFPLLQSIPNFDASNACIVPLDGGTTNQNYRVDSGSESLVLRVSGKGTRLLGIDRAYEYACSSSAAQIGIGANLSGASCN